MNKRILLVVIIVLIILAIFAILKIKRPLVIVSGQGAKPVFTSAAGLYTKAKELEAKGNLYEAKLMYQKLVSEFSNSPEVVNWQRKIEDLNIRLLFSPVLIPKSILYEIKPGDALIKIAYEFKTTAELIQKSNGLKDDKIIPGRKIKVWVAPFNIIVDKSQNTLVLKSDEEIVKTYIVSTGANNSTPVGKFKIVNKLPHPTWFKAGAVVASDSPENILGTRWLGLNLPGYGIHGTTDPQSLGKQITQGCVRMSNSEVEELYDIVPVGAEVTIVD